MPGVYPGLEKFPINRSAFARLLLLNDLMAALDKTFQKAGEFHREDEFRGLFITQSFEGLKVLQRHGLLIDLSWRLQKSSPAPDQSLPLLEVGPGVPLLL